MAPLLRRFGGLAGSGVVGQLIGFAALTYVARQVGASNLGAYGFALALVSYFGLAANFGVTYRATRDVAQDHAATAGVVKEVLLLEGVLALALYGVLLLLTPVLASNPAERGLIPIVGLGFLVSGITLDWALLALERARAVAVWRLVGQVLYALPVPLLVSAGRSGVISYSWLNIFGVAVTAAGLGTVYARIGTDAAKRPTVRQLARRLHQSLPFGYALVMIQIYAGVDALLLGYLDSTHAVGIYTIANKIPAALIVLANSWLSVFFPYAARQLKEDPAGFTRTLGEIVTATLVFVLAVPAGAALCANALMPDLFGHQFVSSSTPFALLSLAASLVFLQSSLSNVLLASDGQRYYLTVISGSAVLMIGMNFALIPRYGPTGSAVATVIGEATLTVCSWIGVRRRLGPVPVELRRVAAGVGIAALVAGAMALLQGIGVVAQIVIGGLLFLGLSWRLRLLRPAARVG